MLAEFASVVDAVRCAIEVQGGMNERNEGLPPERRIAFRLGIQGGDVMAEADGELMGDGVNIAAHLEEIALPGGTCLSEDAFRQVRGKAPTLPTLASAASKTSLSRCVSMRSLPRHHTPRRETRRDVCPLSCCRSPM